MQQSWNGNRQIAGTLALSKHHRQKLSLPYFRQAGISNRVELVLYAVSNPKRGALTRTKHQHNTVSIGKPSAVIVPQHLMRRPGV